jgi:regulator of protease activity HflC (stomatin/prohibitin superfamily)
MGAAQGSEELQFRSYNGYAMFVLAVALLVGSLTGAFAGDTPQFLYLLGLVPAILVAAGLYMLQPNQAAVMMLFGAYRGTDFANGLRWANPLLAKKKISLRLRNFTSERLKVNDRRGNPIEIAAAIVWRIGDTARAVLDIDSFDSYVPIQAEAAVRHIASEYAYDSGEEENQELTLRGGGEQIIALLKRELQARFEKAGLRIEDARLTHLAYAPEIAGAMLRRQQAEAVIAARKQIVHGAVSMVQMALEGLKERGLVDLDDERRAAMVSNLLVVLCSESDPQPVINAGSLYH